MSNSDRPDCDNDDCAIHLTDEEQQLYERMKDDIEYRVKYAESILMDIETIEEKLVSVEAHIDEHDISLLDLERIRTKLSLHRDVAEITITIAEQDLSDHEVAELVVEQHEKAVRAQEIETDIDPEDVLGGDDDED